MADQELKDKIVEWFHKKSTGEKKKFYMKDVVKAMAADYPKKEVQQALNELIEEERVVWFSTGSTNMITLPEFFKG
ncbi:MAG: dissimilatory sulfite reductase D family protein [Dehalococcoidia bacterium]